MKLAFCLFKYFPYGGLQRDFLRIAQACVQRGHQIDVYTMQWEGKAEPLLTIKLIPSKGWQNHTRSKNFVAKLQKILMQQNYDLVVGFNKMPGLDVYYAADSCLQAKLRSKNNFWWRWMPRYRQLITYEKSVFDEKTHTKILLIAKQQQVEFMRYYGTQKERFYFLPPGIAKNRISPLNTAEIQAATRKEFHLQAQDFLLLLVGSGFRTKGLDRALLGIAALPEAIKKRTKLFVIGKDHAQAFQRQVKKLNLEKNILFLGGRDDVPRFLFAADLLLHPAYNENTGTVLLEALTAGLPVLTTDVCGYAHYISEADAGIVLSSPFQQEKFNKTLHTMLLSPERDLWRQNALAFAQQADIYSMPEKAVKIIESIYAST